MSKYLGTNAVVVKRTDIGLNKLCIFRSSYYKLADLK